MPSFDLYPRTMGTDPGSSAVVGQGISSTSASGGPYMVQEELFYVKAGAGGAADDVVLYDATLPCKRFILDVTFLPITGVASSTVTLRDAKAGGGNAVSSALASVTAGTIARTTTAPTAAIASGGTLALRRSDSGIAGILLVLWIPTV